MKIRVDVYHLEKRGESVPCLYLESENDAETQQLWNLSRKHRGVFELQRSRDCEYAKTALFLPFPKVEIA